MSALSARGKPRTEFYGNRATQKEPSCLDSYDFCDPLRLEWRRQSIDNATEQIGVQENAPDISMAVDLGNLLIQRGCQLDVEATPPELVPDVCREFADPTPSGRRAAVAGRASRRRSRSPPGRQPGPAASPATHREGCVPAPAVSRSGRPGCA